MNWNPENISFCTAGEDKKETNQDGAVKNDSVNHFRENIKEYNITSLFQSHCIPFNFF